MEIVFFQGFSDKETQIIFLRGGFFGEFLDQSVFHDDKLVLERNVTFFTHVECNDQSFDQIELGFKVFESDCVKSVENFVVLRCVLDHGLERLVFFLFEDFVITVSGEWTSDRHFQSTRLVRADDVANGFVELVFLKDFITFANFIVANLTIGNENDVLTFVLNNGGGDAGWSGSASTFPSRDNVLKFLFANFGNVRLPNKKGFDLRTVKSENLAYSIKVVSRASN